MANDGLYYLYSDHLGSTSAMTDPNGSLVGEVVRYYPFGGYRTAPTARQSAISDRGFTGHKSGENGGDNDLGLIYMNARFFVVSIGRFASADTIVPNPANPQSHNRYTYVLNSPLNFRDPSGHNPICNHVNTICSDGAYDDGHQEPTYGLETTLSIINGWKATGTLYDPARTEPLKAPIVVNNQILGYYYAMPVGAEQSTVLEDSGRYKFGRFLSRVGIALDIGELILSVIPMAGIGPAYTDAGVTYLSGLFTGDNYFGNAPPGLPDMLSINQDALVNGLEAIIPSLAATAFGVNSLLADAATAPIPGDSLLYMSGGVIVTQIIDATTSAFSGIYDYARHEDILANYITFGVSFEGFLIVYWPQDK